MSNGDPCICGATDTWHPECYQRQQEEATKAAHDEIRKQARADALREAAKTCRSERVDAEDTGDPTDRAYNHACDDCAEAILSLIDQPQEDVCEWSRPKGWSGMYDTGCGYLLDYEDAFKFCPCCGKLINVKEQL